MTSPTRVIIWTVLYLPEELIYGKVLQRRIEFLLFSLYTEHLPLTCRTITWLQLYSCNTPKRRWKPEKGAAAWSIKNVMYATKAAGDFFMVFVVIMKVYTFQIDHRWMHFLQSDMRGISIRARKLRKIWPWKDHEKIVCLLLQLLLWVGAGGRPRSCFGLSVVLSGYISALWLMICGHETTSRQPSRRIRHTKLIFWDVITLLGNRVATFLSSLLWSSNKRVGFNNRLIECHTIRGLYTRAKEALSFFFIKNLFRTWTHTGTKFILCPKILRLWNSQTLRHWDILHWYSEIRRSKDTRILFTDFLDNKRCFAPVCLYKLSFCIALQPLLLSRKVDCWTKFWAGSSGSCCTNNASSPPSCICRYRR